MRPGLRVLDVGGGLGGPARTLAAEFGCQVTVVDPTESYVRTGEALTARLRLTDRVSHRVGDALAVDTAGGMFDVVWTQNSGMNIADKERLYAGFARVLRPGGLLAFQEPMAGPVQPPIFPVMWAPDATTSIASRESATRHPRDAPRARFRHSLATGLRSPHIRLATRSQVQRPWTRPAAKRPFAARAARPLTRSTPPRGGA